MFAFRTKCIQHCIAFELYSIRHGYVRNPSAHILRNTYSIRKYNNIRGEREVRESMKWALLVVPITSFALGCWQVRRREWKLDLIRRLETNSKSHPVDLPEDLGDIAKLEYHPVKVFGHFIHEREMLMGPRTRIQDGGATPRPGSLINNSQNNNGWLVITPFQLRDRTERILVNRGWVPDDHKAELKKTEGEIELIGLVRLQEKQPRFSPKNSPLRGQWLYRDLEHMRKASDSAAVWLDARGIIGDASDGWPIPNQTPMTLRNEHMSYSITWFGLSALTFLMWLRRLRIR